LAGAASGFTGRSLREYERLPVANPLIEGHCGGHGQAA